ncbi:hypothetical protein DAKH74_036640 [Maudiozyma humilis]|uniref:Uncharacterized protein n=1 Tax=Maudiozyma humilis TaxID=51915 RepID=A0AAV5S016_MAUHU|nr:hypothetical protein DAKH74_036640 [Kazachstania humilis]
MDVRSPERAVQSPGDSVILTPFKERALEEQRRRDSLILSLTPGLRRRNEVQASVAPLNNDKIEVRTYLRDLSSALASRDGGRNLTQALLSTSGAAADEEDMEEEPAHGFNTSVNSFNAAQGSFLEGIRSPGREEIAAETGSVVQSPEPTRSIVQSPEPGESVAQSAEATVSPTHSSETQERNTLPLTLSQQILAEAPRLRSGAKIRKLEPVYIPGVSAKSGGTAQGTGDVQSAVEEPLDAPIQRDVPESLPTNTQEPLPTNTQESLPNPFVNTNNVPVAEPGANADIPDFNMDMPDFDMDLDDGNDAPGTAPLPPPITQSDVYTAPLPLSKVHPVSQAQLHRTLDTFTTSHSIRLGSQAWKALGAASVPVLEAMARGLDETGSGIVVPSQANIRQLLERYGCLDRGSSSNDLFALCSSHLASEDLAALERLCFK